MTKLCSKREKVLYRTQHIARCDNFRFSLFEKLNVAFVCANDVFGLIRLSKDWCILILSSVRQQGMVLKFNFFIAVSH